MTNPLARVFESRTVLGVGQTVAVAAASRWRRRYRYLGDSGDIMIERENEYEVRFCAESHRLSFVRIEDGEVFDDFVIPPEAASVVARVIIDFALTGVVIDRRCISSQEVEQKRR